MPRVTQGAGWGQTRGRVLTAIAELTAELGVAPTFREIGDRVGLASKSTVMVHLHKLRDAGLIDFRDGCPRTVRVLEKAS